MPRRPTDKSKLREDANESGFRVIQEALGERPKTLPPRERTEKNPEAVKRGRKGGKARYTKLPSKRRKAIARKAAKARWEGRPPVA